MIAGSFITPDDQNGILIGQSLAQKLGIKVGDQIDLSANTANGDVNEQNFIVRGTFSTIRPHTIKHDFHAARQGTSLHGHTKPCQHHLYHVGQPRFSNSVASALNSPGYQVLTWQKMNDLSCKWNNSPMAIWSHLFDRARDHCYSDCQHIDHGCLRTHARDRHHGRNRHERSAHHGLVPGGSRYVGGRWHRLWFVLGWLVCAYFARYGFLLEISGRITSSYSAIEFMRC